MVQIVRFAHWDGLKPNAINLSFQPCLEQATPELERSVAAAPPQVSFPDSVHT